MNRLALSLLLSSVLSACGARSALRDPTPPVDVVFVEAGIDVQDVQDVPDVRDVQDVQDVRDVQDVPDACVPVNDNCGATEICGNGLDDDCDGLADEACGCEPGSVQSCFRGPPGRRNVGACRDGAQTCEMTGTWGPCTGDIPPREDICNGQDNLCTGCSEQRDCPILCPSPGDPRTPDTVPFRNYPLRGGEFYMGPARSWRWQVQGGPCDRILGGSPSFELRNPNAQNAMFVPRLSGDYTVNLSVTTGSGAVLSCSWVVHVEGPGLRVEMCWANNRSSGRGDVDLDLYLHSPFNQNPWFAAGSNAFQPTLDSCAWHNCEAGIRGQTPTGNPVPRADWGYMRSPLSECENGPQGNEWRMLGFCANPRLDIDNNLSMGPGLPENINIDRPRSGETFRIMVQNFTGGIPAREPIVNVYCSGRRVATFGAAPDLVQNFAGSGGNVGPGGIWRVADVTTMVDAAGRTDCTVQRLNPPGQTRGYWITDRDGRY